MIPIKSTDNNPSIKHPTQTGCINICCATGKSYRSNCNLELLKETANYKGEGHS